MILLKQIDYVLQRIRDIEKSDSNWSDDSDIICSNIINLNSAVSNLKKIDIPIQENYILASISELPIITINLSALNSRTWDDEIGLGLLVQLIKRIRRRYYMNRLFKSLAKLENILLRVKAEMISDLSIKSTEAN